MHVCTQKNERLAHPFIRIFLLALFPDLHFVVIFCSSEFMCRVSLYGHYSLFFSTSPPTAHTFVTQDDTYHAMNKLSNVYQIRQMKLCAANWTDLSICNKLSNTTHNNQPKSYKREMKQYVTNSTNLTIN